MAKKYFISKIQQWPNPLSRFNCMQRLHEAPLAIHKNVKNVRRHCDFEKNKTRELSLREARDKRARLFVRAIKIQAERERERRS